MSITFDGVGEIENSFAQLTAKRVSSSLGEDNTSTHYVIVKHISIPDFKPQSLTQFHRSKAVSHIPLWVIVIHYRIGLLVHAIVEDLHIGVCFGEGVCPQTCSSVDLQSESSSASPQRTAVMVQVGSWGAVLKTSLVLLQLVIFNILCDSASQISTDL